MPELSLWQEVALLGLALLAILYVFTFRIWVALATGADLLFALALGSCVVSIALPAVFGEGARYVVEASPLPPVLASADERLDALEALPGQIVARALAKVGYEEEPPEEAVERQPLGDSTGRIESSVLPAVESLIGLVLRTTTFASSLFLLMVALALRSSTSTTRQIRELIARIEVLESGTQASEV